MVKGMANWDLCDHFGVKESGANWDIENISEIVGIIDGINNE